MNDTISLLPGRAWSEHRTSGGRAKPESSFLPNRRQENTRGSGDVEDESRNAANWGILSPLEPWAGWDAQTSDTGIIAHVWPMRPWFAPENEQNQPWNNKNSKDISVVTPPIYDTAL